MPDDDSPRSPPDARSPGTLPRASNGQRPRKLLVSSALATIGAVAMSSVLAACGGDQPLPGNPKGSGYPAEGEPPPEPPPPTDTTGTYAEPPLSTPPSGEGGSQPALGNPKGPGYDLGVKKPRE